MNCFQTFEYLRSCTTLEGGGTQSYIDWSHPDNAPVKEWLLKTVQVKATGWKDLQLPVDPYARAVYLTEAERSAKIRQEGYVLRAGATAGKQPAKNEHHSGN